MVGTVGDRLIELAAGWGIVLVVSGLYLWWPRGRASALFWPRLHLRGRPLWRDLHVVAGFWGSLLLLFMLLSGMTWTGYWGKVRRCLEPLPGGDVERCADLRHAGR